MLTPLALLLLAGSKPADPLADGFRNPPASARPHTWWHWMNGNVTREGITADLEAMKEAGIGGAQMFTVDQGIPAGPAGYAGPKWRELTAHAVREAGRLGIELCLHNCAGWSSSGGPWIKPEDAMQVLAWSEKKVEGPQTLDETLPQPQAPQVYSKVPYYRDIAVFAYRTPADSARPNDFLARTGVVRGDGLQPDLTDGPGIPKGEILNLTDRLTPDGHLNWNVPDGSWTILRMGHVPTGKDNHPAPPEGDGLEVDKLSREALDKHWAGLMAKVIADAGPLAGKVLNNSLIDSYEVGSQNWTPRFREEFRKRRGYDPLPFLPTVAGVTVESKEITERFLWDLRRTIADLYADNYYGHFAELCHRAGLKFSTEPYGNGGFEDLQAGSKADIPMGEFWIGGAAMETAHLAASVAHVNGKPIVGAESFTADEVRGRWLEEPYGIKALGDLAFCEGINRYIFHRYAAQPWVDVRPGMTMGPWGTHLDRTQTWWSEAKEWLRYVARSQYLLQQGRFVADVCYFTGEDAPVTLPGRRGLRPALPQGYDFDGCDAAAVRSMTVRDGRVTLPSGMSYAVLVLPESTFMTPGMARKIRDLVAAGATVIGPKPLHTPSLSGYPASEAELATVASSLWGGGAPGTRTYGKGRLLVGIPLESALPAFGIRPDFEFAPHSLGTKLIDIHRKIGDADVYFVSNQNYRSTRARCTFRVAGRTPELWHADTGRIEEAPAYQESNGRTSVDLSFDPAESVFVVFRKRSTPSHLVAFRPTEAKETVAARPKIEIVSARYGSADGRGADVTGQVRRLVAEGEVEVPATNDLFGDPVLNVVKRLVVEYRLNGKTMRAVVPENDRAVLAKLPSDLGTAAYTLLPSSSGTVELAPWRPGSFFVTTASGRSREVRATEAARTVDLSTGWNVAFAPNLGAPPTARFDHLVSWPERPEPGIRYFSGSATYSREFDLKPDFVKGGRSVRLDLGQVKYFATVSVNGRPVATLWKPPFALDVTPFVHAGRNRVSVKVTNLWPNRIIGDEQLPPEVKWDGNHLASWPDWLTPGKARIAADRPKTGRITFATWRYYDKNSPLLESGLLGPVRLQSARRLSIAKR